MFLVYYFLLLYAILEYISIGISADAVRILLHAGLMKPDEKDGTCVITQAGFQFLLLDTAAQVDFINILKLHF